MPGKTTIISVFFFLLLVIVPQFVHAAASTSAFGGRRSLLALRGIHSSIYLEYQFDRSNTYGKTDSEFLSHGFTEELTVGGKYSFYRPEFWRGIYKVSVGSNQFSNYRDGQSLGRSSNFLQKYDFISELFYLSRSPLFLKSALTETSVERKYAENYYQWTETHLANLNIKNRTLPSNLSYSRSLTETSGLQYNRVTKAQSLSLSISHKLRSFMSTGLGYARTQNTERIIELGSSSSNDRVVTSVNNYLKLPYWFKSLTLSSSYRYSEHTGEDQGRERYWKEGLDWKPGRALRVGLVYTVREKNSLDVMTEDVSTRGNLIYHLYHSLSLSLHLSEMDKTFQNGKQQNESIMMRMTYRKNLDKGSRFTLNFEQGFEDLTRELTTSTQSVLGEVLIIDLTGINFLANSNVAAGSVVVRDATDTFNYFEGIDYALSSFGDFTEIEILPGSAISDGDQLSVSYSYLVNPSISYTTDRKFVSSVLSLYEGDLRFLGRFSISERNRTAGADNLISLNSMRLYSLGVIGQLKPFRFDLTYTDTDTDNYTIQQLEASWGYDGKLAGGALLLNLGDVYQIYRAETTAKTNRVSGRAIYRYRLSRNTTMKTEAEAQSITGDGVSRRIFSLEVDLAVRYRKTSFSLRLGEKYLDYETKDAWNENLMISMRRNF